MREAWKYFGKPFFFDHTMLWLKRNLWAYGLSGPSVGWFCFRLALRSRELLFKWVLNQLFSIPPLLCKPWGAGRALPAVGATLMGASLGALCHWRGAAARFLLCRQQLWLAKAYGREVVLSSGDRNAFSCLGYVTSYSVVIKYRPFTGLGKGGVQLTSSRCCGMGRGWSKAAQDKGDEWGREG